MLEEWTDVVDDTRMIVEIFDRDGKLVERSVGPSTAELLIQHSIGDCTTTYPWCHQELADKIGEDAAVAMMYERAFGVPMPEKITKQNT